MCMFNTAYMPGLRVVFNTVGPSLTKQAFKEDCDINVILQRASRTGVLEHANSVSKAYGEFFDALDYQESLNKVLSAQEAFNGLSAPIRKRFHNDPSEFLEFFNDLSNFDEGVRLGLFNPKSSEVAATQPHVAGVDAASGKLS